MDVFDHVNNGVSHTYIEDERITFFKRWNICDKKKSIIAASIKIEHLIQMKHPSHLILGQRVSRIDSKSFDIESALFINGEEDPMHQ